MTPAENLTPAKRPSRIAKLTARVSVAALIVALVGAIASAGTSAAYKAVTANGPNTFASGTVAIGDDDAGAALFSLTGLTPSTKTRCILVSYSGSLASTVRLYGTTAGSGLDAYLTLTVTRGSGLTGAAGECTGFTADATDYNALGAGVLYTGTLTAYPDTYAAGLVDPGGSWATSATHAYKLAVTLQDNAAAVSKNATQTFSWEARNS